MKWTSTRFWLFALVAIGMASCVSNRKIAYLQKENYKRMDFEDYNESFALAKDTIVLEQDDVVSVDVNHIQLSQMEVHIGLEGDQNSRLGVQHPYLTGFNIDADGFIDLPTLGRTKIGGLTLYEAQEVIRVKARLYYPDPSVKVFLMSNYVTVLGEVNNPGRYPVYNNQTTIFDALGMASDMTDLADRNDLRVIRRRSGVNQMYHVNLNTQDILASQDLYMQPDDVILVTPLKAKKFIRRDPQNILSSIGTVISLTTLYLLITQ